MPDMTTLELLQHNPKRRLFACLHRGGPTKEDWPLLLLTGGHPVPADQVKDRVNALVDFRRTLEQESQKDPAPQSYVCIAGWWRPISGVFKP